MKPQGKNEKLRIRIKEVKNCHRKFSYVSKQILKKFIFFQPCETKGPKVYVNPPTKRKRVFPEGTPAKT